MPSTQTRIEIIVYGNAREALKRIQTSFDSVTSAAKRSGGAIFNIRNALYAITGSRVLRGLKDMTMSFIKTADSFKQMEIRLQTLGMKNTGQATNWIVGFAKQNPVYALNTYQDAFLKLKANGIDPMTGSLQALTDAVAAFGGDELSFERATLAIQQMVSKGVLSAEELRRQLAEQIPSAIQDMAKALGMTVEQMMKEIERGGIKSAGAVDKLFALWSEKFKGAAARRAETWQGMVNQMKLDWSLLQKEVMDAGLFDSIRASLKDLVQAFRNNAEAIKAIASDTMTATSAAGEVAAKLANAWAVGSARRRLNIAISQRESAKARLSEPWWMRPFQKDEDLRAEVATQESLVKQYAAELNKLMGKDYAVPGAWEKAIQNKRKSALPDMTITAQPSEWDKFLRGFNDGMVELQKKWKDTLTNMQTAGTFAAQSIASAMSSSFNELFIDAIEGRLKQFKDYLLSFFKDIARAMSQMLAQQISVNLLGYISGSFGAGGGAASATTGAAAAAGRRKAGGGQANVQIINNSGTPLSGSATTSTDALGNTVMSIVLDRISRNVGGSRDALRGAMA